jgi:hypothetical protein
MFVTTAENDISKLFKAMEKNMYVCHNTSGFCAQVALGKLIAIDVRFYELTIQEKKMSNQQ